MYHKPAWHVKINLPYDVAAISDEFLGQLVSELDNEDVTAIILKGSAARREETVFSDIDLGVFVRGGADSSSHGQFFYREGRLINVSTGTLEQYRKRFLIPEEAIFVIPGLREARILLDKEGAFKAFQQEAMNWSWEPLQAKANSYASQIMRGQSEIVHKVLRAFLLQDELALSEMVLILFSALTDAMAVQRGVLAKSENTYYCQVQEAVGSDSDWTRYHRVIAGVGGSALNEASTTALEVRGVAALRLYQESARLFQAVFSPMHRRVVEQAFQVIELALAEQ